MIIPTLGLFQKKTYDTFIKGGFPLFRAILGVSCFKASACGNKDYKKIPMEVWKNARFYADSKFVEKIAKKSPKKDY